MDLTEKRIQELMDNLNAFCLDHKVTGDDCEKCPFAKYEDCPLNEFYIKCWFAIHDDSFLTLKRRFDLL